MGDGARVANRAEPNVTLVAGSERFDIVGRAAVLIGLVAR
jgi:hypothetical protein